MVTKMILITVLILAILGATYVKDKDAMNPPLKRRIVIDLTVIGTLWLLYLIFEVTKTASTAGIAEQVINWGLYYFIAQLIYLVGSISPMFKGLQTMLQKKGVNIPEVEEEEKEETKGKE